MLFYLSLFSLFLCEYRMLHQLLIEKKSSNPHDVIVLVRFTFTLARIQDVHIYPDVWAMQSCMLWEMFAVLMVFNNSSNSVTNHVYFSSQDTHTHWEKCAYTARCISSHTHTCKNIYEHFQQTFQHTNILIESCILHTEQRVSFPPICLWFLWV